MEPNTTDDDSGGSLLIDFVSNGFKIRNADGSTALNQTNYDGAEYVYAAWAAVPTNNLYRGQATAR